jgi:RND family efflux transporter MFP subunit
VCSAGGCSRPRAEGAGPAAQAPTVAVTRIARGDLSQTLTISAEFRPFQEIDVHAKVAGYVKAINVDVGDRVQAGQLLAVLELPELQDEMNQDDANVRRADQEVKRAEADLQRAESAHEVAHLGATRLAGVSKARPNLVAQQDVDEAAGRDRVAEAQVATARASLASGQQQVEASRAAQHRTQTLFGYAQITAPFAGVITHRYADTGAMIQAGTSSQTQTMPLVRLSQNTRLRLVIRVPESAVAHVHTGAPVDLTVDALHRTFTGTVARFADRLDTETRTMDVEVDVPNPSLELVPGMYADARLVLDQARGVLIAPVEAIDRTSGTPQLFVVTSGGIVDVRPVTLGLDAGDRVEIKSGVSAGDEVVTANRAQLRAGLRVLAKVVVAGAQAAGGQ